MAKPSRMIKLSVNMRPFVSRVSRNGAVQRAFREQIGNVVGGCVRARTAGKVLTAGEVKDAVRDCAKQAKGTHLNIGGRQSILPRGQRFLP